MRIGLDLHGVIDSNPKFWASFSRLLVVGNDHEVHIIMGPPIKKVMAKLVRFHMCFTHLFSIVDYHRDRGTKMWQDELGRWNMSPYEWDKTKADYCVRQEIDLHIDDSSIYGKFFITPYAMYLNKLKSNSNCGTTVER